LEDRLARLEQSTSQDDSPASDIGGLKMRQSILQRDEIPNPSIMPTQESDEHTDLFSLTSIEAQKTIQQALRNAIYLNENGRNSMSSVLSSIKEILHRSEREVAPITQEQLFSISAQQIPDTPSVEFLQEVLQCNERIVDSSYFPMFMGHQPKY
jgi:hypothetical protein